MDLFLRSGRRPPDIKEVIKMFSNTMKIVDGLDKMVGVVLHQLNTELQAARSSNGIIEAYLYLDGQADLHELVGHKLKEKALNVGLNDIGIKKISDRFAEFFGNSSRMSKYTEFFVKALNDSLKNLDVDNEDELIYYIMEEQTIRIIFKLEQKFKKPWIKNFFPPRKIFNYHTNSQVLTSYCQIVLYYSDWCVM